MRRSFPSAATASGRRGTPSRCAVLIPAHNEELVITSAIHNVRDQLAPGDRILVVADNCTDQTAEVARAAGAEVAERTDPDHRGKGFALDFGLSQLAPEQPPVVVVVDADCELDPGALDALVRQAAATGRPAQGVYLIGTGQEPDPRRRLSAFAVLLKNEIRPLGLDRLGLPCLLNGTGMAFPGMSSGPSTWGRGTSSRTSTRRRPGPGRPSGPALPGGNAIGGGRARPAGGDQAADAMGTRACTNASHPGSPLVLTGLVRGRPG